MESIATISPNPGSNSCSWSVREWETPATKSRVVGQSTDEAVEGPPAGQPVRLHRSHRLLGAPKSSWSRRISALVWGKSR